MDYPTPEYLEDRIKHRKRELDLLLERYTRMLNAMTSAYQTEKWLEWEVASWVLGKLKMEIERRLGDG